MQRTKNIRIRNKLCVRGSFSATTRRWPLDEIIALGNSFLDFFKLYVFFKPFQKFSFTLKILITLSGQMVITQVMNNVLVKYNVETILRTS